jgi:hypothetical protein
MADRDAVLDALMEGSSIEAAADRFGLREAEVREILKDETDRAYDGEELRAEWTLTARRLRRMELKFDAKAIADLDCTAAIVAIKASERRASLQGAGSALPSHLLTIMHAQAIAEAPTSTQLLRNSLDNLLGIGRDFLIGLVQRSGGCNLPCPRHVATSRAIHDFSSIVSAFSQPTLG